MSKGSDPRKHHKVPRWYLEGFGNQSGKVHTFDLAKLAFRPPSRPSQLACQRDYYRLEIDEGDSFALEKTFGELECQAREVVKSMLDSRQLPTGDSYGVLISFIALQFARTERTRRTWGTVGEKLYRSILADAVDAMSEEEFQTVAAKVHGGDVPSGVTLGGLREAISGEFFNFHTTQSGHLRNLSRLFASISKMLADRRWFVAIAPKDAQFIASDNPVCLMWDDPKMYQTGSPGFGMPGTIVALPLRKDAAILGTYEEPLEKFIFADQEFVASVNLMTLRHALREIYSGDSDFIWLNGRSVERSDALIEFIKTELAAKRPLSRDCP